MKLSDLIDLPVSMSGLTKPLSKLPIQIWAMTPPLNIELKDFDTVFLEWMKVYKFLSAQGLVFLLPSKPSLGGGFYRNSFIPLYNIKDKEIILCLSALGEERHVVKNFFEILGYEVCSFPSILEGFEVKYIPGSNVYIAGMSKENHQEFYGKIEKSFDLNIISYKHKSFSEQVSLSSLIFIPDFNSVVVCTDKITVDFKEKLEKYVNIVSVPYELLVSGVTDCLRVNFSLCSGTNICILKKGSEEYSLEKKKNDFIENLAVQLGLEPIFFDFSANRRIGRLFSEGAVPLNLVDYYRPGIRDLLMLKEGESNDSLGKMD